MWQFQKYPMRWLVVAGACFCLVGCIFFGKGLLLKPAFADDTAKTSLYDFSFTSIEGEEMPFDVYRGKVVLLVNTASMCGFTPQYEGLQALYDTYKDAGLVVIGVPSGDFGGQEYDSSAQIKDFCTVNYSINFPMTERTVVKGEEAHPLYRWLLQKMGARSAPSWNFHKFVFDVQGQPVEWFSHFTSPESAKLKSLIRVQLQRVASHN
jgi:glutathione peroxidase